METVIIVAVARNGVIGVDGGLPWRIPEDMGRFRKITMDHALIMGRATFESIGRPLPGRTNIVLTRSHDWAQEGVEVAASLDAALEAVATRNQDAFIAGGAEVYRQGLEVAGRIEMTEIDLSPQGDTWFPPVDWSQWQEISREDHPGFAFVTYERM
jgi:dihydrofolate reductase